MSQARKSADSPYRNIDFGGFDRQLPTTLPGMKPEPTNQAAKPQANSSPKAPASDTFSKK